MSSTLILRATNPDLILAPSPQLSQGAWIELQENGGNAKSVTVHAQITATHGSINAVVVQEIQRWPRTAADVQSWIKQQWRFVPTFSGTVVQPISFRIVKAAALPTPGPQNMGPWRAADWSLFAKAPKPEFPHGYDWEVKEYQIHHRYLPGVLLLMTARKGTMVDIRVLDQKGPIGLCDFTVEWVRKHWQFRPDITGSYRLPVYYELR